MCTTPHLRPQGGLVGRSAGRFVPNCRADRRPIALAKRAASTQDLVDVAGAVDGMGDSLCITFSAARMSLFLHAFVRLLVIETFSKCLI